MYTVKDYTQMKHDFIANGLFNPTKEDFDNVHTYVNDTYQAFLSVRPPNEGYQKHIYWSEFREGLCIMWVGNSGTLQCLDASLKVALVAVKHTKVE